MLTLAITGFETDPDRVTEILQITPTTIGRVGDIGRSGRPAASNGWWLEAHEERLTDGRRHSAALATIVGRLKGKEKSFAVLRERVRPDTVTIYGGLYLGPDEQCGLWLTAAEMQLLGACGVGWGLDLFVED